jgi:hypothetical protein
MLKRTLAVAVAATIASLALATPAQAVAYARYATSDNALCIGGENSDAGLFLVSCSTSTLNDWQTELRPQTGSSNTVMKLRNRQSGRCLDSKSNTNGTIVYNIGCNLGNNQLWEKFYNKNGTITLKSWGAWKSNARHLCIAKVSHRPALATCNANLASQQWIQQS